MEVRITRSARKHRIGAAHILSALAAAGPPDEDDDALIYVGTDDRGVELEIVVVRDDRYTDQPERLAIIHVMPTAYRDREQP